MPSRGSAQFLLLFVRSRPRLGWTMGAIACALVLAGLLRAGGEFPLLTRTGIAHLLHQSAWQHALAGTPEGSPWPWDGTPTATTADVPQLGLSASAIEETNSDRAGGLALDSQHGQDADRHDPRARLSELGIGDHITVTTADGASRDYRVTGRKIVDPHLAETDSAPLDADATLVTCLPLDPLLANSLRLVIQATAAEPPASPESGPEQKL